MVGNGMAGVRTLEELLKLAPEACDITVFGCGAASQLQPDLAVAGAVRRADARPDHAERSRLVRGERDHAASRQEVVRIDRAKRRVLTADGLVAPYDRLLLATGSGPVILPIPGKDLPGVITYRDIADTDAMIDAATRTVTRSSSAADCSASKPPTGSRRAG
jgi:nitrite reductase (NADH) large subunit